MSEHDEAMLAELQRMGTKLVELRLESHDSLIYAIACLKEAAYLLQAVRAVGIVKEEQLIALLVEVYEVAIGEPESPVAVAIVSSASAMPEPPKGKPN